MSTLLIAGICGMLLLAWAVALAIGDRRHARYESERRARRGRP